MKTIDVAREPDTSAFLEANIGGQPLISIGPVGWIDIPSAPVPSLVSNRLVLGYDLPLAAPPVDSILYSNYFLAKYPRVSVDEWVERWMDEILNHVVGARVPVWIVHLLELQLGKRGLKTFMQRLVDASV